MGSVRSYIRLHTLERLRCGTSPYNSNCNLELQFLFLWWNCEGTTSRSETVDV